MKNEKYYSRMEVEELIANVMMELGAIPCKDKSEHFMKWCRKCSIEFLDCYDKHMKKPKGA